MSHLDSVPREKLNEFLEPYLIQWTYYAENHWQCVLDNFRTQNRDVEYGGKRDNVPFPDLPHLEYFASLWYEEHRLQCDKSRQLTMTWLVCMLTLHELMFRENALVGYQNLNLKAACDKLENYMLYSMLRVPWTNMLPWVRVGEDPAPQWIEMIAKYFDLDLSPPSPPTVKQSPYYGSRAYLVASALTNRYDLTRSKDGVESMSIMPYFMATTQQVVAVPSGAAAEEKWRGYTFTRAIHDEYGFYLGLADTISSAAQTLGKHGFQVLITTPSIGKDGDEIPFKMTQRDEGMDGHPRLVRWPEPPYGVELWITRQNYLHIRIWYYTHPDRREKDYLDRTVYTGDVRKNQREILLRYDIPENDPFYAVYAQKPEEFALIGAEDKAKGITFKPHPTCQIAVGQDGGRTPASLVMELWPDGHVVAAFEIESNNSSIHGHLPKLHDALRRHYGEHYLSRTTVYCDPAMFFKQESSDASAAEAMIRSGFRVEEGKQDPDERFQSMSSLIERRITTPKGHRPILLVNTAACPRFHAGMSGACDVDANSLKIGINKKNKNSFSHIVEGGEYAATRISAFRQSRVIAPPKRHWKGSGAR